jgi:hypothetical protein
MTLLESWKNELPSFEEMYDELSKSNSSEELVVGVLTFEVQWMPDAAGAGEQWNPWGKLLVAALENRQLSESAVSKIVATIVDWTNEDAEDTRSEAYGLLYTGCVTLDFLEYIPPSYILNQEKLSQESLKALAKALENFKSVVEATEASNEDNVDEVDYESTKSNIADVLSQISEKISAI